MDYTIEIVAEDSPRLFRPLYKVTMKTMRTAGMVLAGFMSLSYFLFAFTENKGGDLRTALLYLAVAVLFWSIPWWMGSLSYRKKLKYHDGKIPASVARFGEEISLKDADSAYNIPYDKIKKLVMTEDAMVLWLMDGRAIAISKGPFTQGSLQELLALLKEKCPLLKLPDWK